jgi:Protein of unknown function (DUF2855)
MPASGERARYFEVKRADLRHTRWTEETVPTVDALQPNQIAVRVERFALTANNITYGVLGERLGYWAFFPAEAGWGRIPAWGLGDVVTSRHPEVRPGERLFGYVPMGSDVVLQPGRLSPAHFTEASPHRARLDPTYNHYLRLTGDPAYDRRWDSHLALLRPLILTALVLEAFLAHEQAFGARRIVLASASSKTAVATAFLLSRERPGRREVIGLTSPAHAEFCRRLTCYDRVFAYGRAHGRAHRASGHVGERRRARRHSRASPARPDLQRSGGMDALGSGPGRRNASGRRPVGLLLAGAHPPP